MAHQEIVKEKIAEAMKELVREKNMEDISVPDICAQSNVNRRTFYRYFSDKFEVIEWIYYNDFLQKLQMPGEADLYYAMDASVRLVLEDRKYYVNVFKYRDQNSFRQYCARHLLKLCYSEFRECFASDELYQLYMGHAIETACDFFELSLSTNSDLTPETLLQAFRDLFYLPGKRFAEILENEYKRREGGTPYQTAEPSRKQKK